MPRRRNGEFSRPARRGVRRGQFRQLEWADDGCRDARTLRFVQGRNLQDKTTHPCRTEPKVNSRPHAEERAPQTASNKRKLECARVSKHEAASSFETRATRCLPSRKAWCLRAPQNEAEQRPAPSSQFIPSVIRFSPRSAPASLRMIDLHLFSDLPPARGLGLAPGQCLLNRGAGDGGDHLFLE